MGKGQSPFIERHDVGTLLKNINDLAPLVSDLLRNPEQLALYKKNLIALEKKHGGNEIKRLIDTLLKS